MERRFELIDGNMSKASNLEAYCTFRHGFLTDSLIRTHNCKKKKDGCRCPRLEILRYTDADHRQKH